MLASPPGRSQSLKRPHSHKRILLLAKEDIDRYAPQNQRTRLWNKKRFSAGQEIFQVNREPWSGQGPSSSESDDEVNNDLLESAGKGKGKQVRNGVESELSRSTTAESSSLLISATRDFRTPEQQQHRPLRTSYFPCLFSIQETVKSHASSYISDADESFVTAPTAPNDQFELVRIPPAEISSHVFIRTEFSDTRPGKYIGKFRALHMRGAAWKLGLAESKLIHFVSEAFRRQSFLKENRTEFVDKSQVWGQGGHHVSAADEYDLRRCIVCFNEVRLRFSFSS